MTHTIEQERATFEGWARDRYPSIDLTRDGNDYSKALAKDYWSLWQAARRAPAVPVQEGWKLVPDANNMTDEQAEAICNLVSCCGGGAHEVYEAALSAAPQPPDAFQTEGGLMCENSTSKPSAQASVSNATLAAPVDLPEPAARTTSHDGELYWENHIPGYGSKFGAKLYTEQQVRQLLAAHGIQEQST